MIQNIIVNIFANYLGIISIKFNGFHTTVNGHLFINLPATPSSQDFEVKKFKAI